MFPLYFFFHSIFICVCDLSTNFFKKKKKGFDTWWRHQPNTGECTKTTFRHLVHQKTRLCMRVMQGKSSCHKDREKVWKQSREQRDRNTTEKDNFPQSSDKLNVTRWLLSLSAVTVNSGLEKMSKMFSCAWAELITEPTATQTGAANGSDLQIKLHLPRLFSSCWSNLPNIKYFGSNYYIVMFEAWIWIALRSAFVSPDFKLNYF